MIPQRASWLLIFFIFTISFGEATAANSCSPACGTGKTAQKVPYPFGFSPGCPIHLNCTNNTAKIGEFHVLNVTAESVFVELPAKCNRDLRSLHPLFSKHYGMMLQNSLLLQDCTARQNSCVIQTAFVEQFNLSTCEGKNDNIVCYSFSSKNEGSLLSYEDLNKTECKFVFTSFAFNTVGQSSGSLQFQRVELSWWLLNGNLSSCHKNAEYKPVKIADGKNGFRCQCKEGFHGDGFAPPGSGCKKNSGCNASKYFSGHCGGTKLGALIAGLISGASIVAGLALICYCMRRRSTLKNQLSAKRLLCEAAGNSSVPFVPYKEIERATSFFSEKQRLGTGAYGTVYAGKLHNDEWVAIKRFRYRDTDSIDQVMNEIKLLSSVSHPNLVRLLGCCIEEGEPILVYEFMPNGTLSQHLQRERGTGLPWTIRLTIATETACAIAYLHSAMNPPIYHRDIKSSNILLDFNYKSKVADFGLSRLGMTESSHISTVPQGTPGYLDPQYHQYFHLSDKSDVYSFGVVLVEIITAMKVVDFSRPHSEVNLAALAIDRIGRGCVDDIIDPYLEPNRDAWTLSSVHNVAELAFRCLAFHRDMRPTMMEVAEELEQIRVSSWASNIYMASPPASISSISDCGSGRSLSSLMGKRIVVKSQRLIVPPKVSDCLTTLDEVKDSSPVSVQDHWLSEQSSPSTNSLLVKVAQ